MQIEIETAMRTLALPSSGLSPEVDDPTSVGDTVVGDGEGVWLLLGDTVRTGLGLTAPATVVGKVVGEVDGSEVGVGIGAPVVDAVGIGCKLGNSVVCWSVVGRRDGS